MRPILLLGAASLVVAAASLACSKAAAPATDNSSDVTENQPAATAAAAATTPPPPPPADTGDAGLVDPDGGAIVVLPSTGTDAGALCAADSIQEVEPNNDATSANVIPAVSSTYCGRVDPGDVDNVTFIMPQSVGNFGIAIDQFAGGVNIQASAGGQPFSFFGQYPFEPGQPYTLQITPRGTRSADYRIRFTFESF